MQNQKIKVLYIAGFERSGSTILNRLLGQIDGFVTVGEIKFIWQDGLIKDNPCACGALFKECGYWQNILNQAFGGIEKIDYHKIARLQQETRTLFIKSLGNLTESSLKDSAGEYITSLEKLYQAIQSCTGAKVIVDSSKLIWYGSTLTKLDNIDLYVVHLVRESYAVCYSLQQHKAKNEPLSQWYNPVHGALSWTLKNSAVEMFLKRSPERYMRINYEDFIQNPKTGLQALLNFLQEEEANINFIEDNQAKLSVNHIFGGSPSSTTKKGLVDLRLDDRWKKGMKPIDKAIVSSLTWPLLRKYGYFQSSKV
ncbi:sulfotransferase [Nostoc ellipsosporum NOK]|nr:sulfotransferase [Nostoc ellipsosporum NOK]BAZ51445.1 hypothetical protein NIES4103_40940 [Nostoc sp. NIES-4103]